MHFGLLFRKCERRFMLGKKCLFLSQYRPSRALLHKECNVCGAIWHAGIAISSTQSWVQYLHFCIQWKRVKSFCGWISYNETTFFVLLFQERFGTLSWHVIHVPPMIKNQILNIQNKIKIATEISILTHIFASPASLFLSHNY